MAVDERRRRALHGKLEGALGPEEAATMMDLLPPSGWDDVARTHHIDQLRAELRGEMSDLRGEFAELRGEFGELRGEFGELRGEFGELRGEVRGGLGEIHRELGLVHRDFGTLQATMAKLTWTMTIGVIGAVVATAGLAFTAATLV